MALIKLVYYCGRRNESNEFLYGSTAVWESRMNGVFLFGWTMSYSGMRLTKVFRDMMS